MDSAERIPTAHAAGTSAACHRLLIVDDERDLCELIRDVGEANGFACTIAASARECLAALAGHSPLLIIVDLQLPGTDGVELLRSLADSDCRAAIAIVSGLERRVLESAARLARCLKLDVLGALQKPVMVEELAALMHRAAARGTSSQPQPAALAACAN